MFSKKTYTERRAALREKVQSGILLFPGNKESGMNYRDNWYPFRQDSTFLYYFGIDLPDLYVLIDLDEDKEILFGNDPSVEEMVWTGDIEPLAVHAERAGVGTVEPRKRLHEYLSNMKQKGRRIHYLPPYRPEVSLDIHHLLQIPVDQIQEKRSVPFIKAVIGQRSIKSMEEVEELNKAVNITANMHKHAIKAAREGKTEKQVAVELQALAIAGGGNISFPIILTRNGQYLHNHATQARLEKGDIVLCDCGAETAMHYAGDMTRTFPVAERFSQLQRQVYSIVLKAHTAAVEGLGPGRRFLDSHFTACSTIVEGLKGMGLMKGSTEEAVAAGAHTLFFQCGLGHFMGLDVHDMENLGEELVGYNDHIQKSKDFGLKSLRLGKELEQGNVLTVEPGIYFNPFLIDAWEKQGKNSDFINYTEVRKFKNFGGMRVEEDFLITADGHQLLGEPLARTAEEIEELKNS